jgi:hypothetical protein
MADGSQLPEIFDFDGLPVRLFPAERAARFPQLPQAERRATPAIVRRLYKAAAIYAAEDAACLICGAAAPVEGRVLVAVETDGGHELGVVCADCARLGELDARTQS